MDIYIRVKNFGKIRHARVNISNFTIFVGNNNSGETQLMELIYAVLKRVSEMSPAIEIPRIGQIDAFSIGEAEIEALNRWVNQDLNKRIDKIIEKTFNASIGIEEIALEFGKTDCSYEIYLLTEQTVAYLSQRNMLSDEELTQIVQDTRKLWVLQIVKQNGQTVKKFRSNKVYFKYFPENFIKSMEIGNVLAHLVGITSPNASDLLFLPASRMGLTLLYKYYFKNQKQVWEDLVWEDSFESNGENADAYEELDSGIWEDVTYENVTGITKPVLDFLSFLQTYSYTERTAKKNRKLIDFIFSHLIDGTITEKGDATVYTPRSGNKEIPVFVASSMVNEIVPVIKALTCSQKIDFIFYDEVETSMHPLKQMEMVKMLNRFNNQGIRLLVSTHSETMAAKINNLLLLSYNNQLDVTQNGNRNIRTQPDDLLVSRQIHVYQFQNDREDQSIVEELEFSKVPYTGYDFRLFNDSTMDLWKEAKQAMGMDDED